MSLKGKGCLDMMKLSFITRCNKHKSSKFFLFFIHAEL